MIVLRYLANEVCTQQVEKEILQNRPFSIAMLDHGRVSFFMLRKYRPCKSTHVSNHQCQPTLPGVVDSLVLDCLSSRSPLFTRIDCK